MRRYQGKSNEIRNSPFFFLHLFCVCVTEKMIYQKRFQDWKGEFFLFQTIYSTCTKNNTYTHIHTIN
jgi:hypothetical protein